MKCKFNEVQITFVDDDSRYFKRQKGVVGTVEDEGNSITVEYTTNNGTVNRYIYPRTLVKEVAIDYRAGQEIADDEYEEVEEYDVPEGARRSERK